MSEDCGWYRLQYAPPHLPGADQRECIAIQPGAAPDLLKTQIKSSPENRQSNRQNPEITGWQGTPPHESPHEGACYFFQT